MPSKIQLDENLWFLYICLQKSDYKAIDFNAVGDATKLKPPAARMRYTRLRRAIESGTLIGTHGTPFQGSADKIIEAQKKRKRLLRNARLQEEDVLGPIQTRSGSRIDRKAKMEDDSTDGYDTDFSTEDDETPLAKKRAVVLKSEVKAVREPSGSGLNTLEQEECKQALASPESIGRLPTSSIDGSKNPPLKDEHDWEKDSENRPGAQTPTTQNMNVNVQRRPENDTAFEPAGIREPRFDTEAQSMNFSTINSETPASPLTALLPLHATSAIVRSPKLTGAATTHLTMSLKAEEEEKEKENKAAVTSMLAFTSSDHADIAGLPVAQDRKPPKYLLDAEQEMKAPLASMIPI
ncbi:MAG: hypothetical protein M1830_008854 [Pleopsidium flavum]|nr:MAG: hypothetical protein M1830_008854 [Pleopsidium flavum]